MIRLIVFFATIFLSVGAGYFLPPFGDPEPSPTATSEAAARTAQPKPSSIPRLRTDTRRNTRAQARKIHLEEMQKRLVQLERGYVIVDDAEGRDAIIDTISEIKTPAIVPTLGRLFAIETDPELKEALIEAVGWSETTDAAKAAVFAVALPAGQPKGARLAAIDGLAELDAKTALPCLQSLADDADEEVRVAVRQAIRSFETP